MNNLKVGFIHITKSGGTNIKDKNKNNELYFGSYHHENALYYYKKQMPCFAIIRCPIERYESMFYYNTFGSNKYSKSNNIEDINLFVDKHYDNPNFINKFENGTQFRKQVSWLNDNNCYIILFDKKKLVNNIEKFLLDEFSIHYKYDYEEKRINVSNIKKKVQLTQNSIDKIKKLYHEDVQLYNNLLGYQQRNLKFYCKLKEL
jgi:hypothetical protein